MILSKITDESFEHRSTKNWPQRIDIQFVISIFLVEYEFVMFYKNSFAIPACTLKLRGIENKLFKETSLVVKLLRH